MYTKLQKPRLGGFTLIEILVVVSIIGILVAILVANFSDARENSKVKALRTTLGEVQLALEVYKAQNGRYPTDTTALAPSFIHDLPVAANFGRGACSFIYSVEPTNGSYYKLTANRCATSPSTDNGVGITQNDEFARCPSTCASTGNCVPSDPAFFKSMAVYSAGGECL
jgi:prepilin-type N-terminal cleavage/methylation domain-containing protein